ncbi:hypothetical protein [Actinokineospora inagensis]|uniref:hypothetical protein n=1 Tax=Actinokineospora inagensis TaxID=103730 RepID=UPI0004045CBF|nr:hypothetical protein [Actinokineospora inagensis]
MTESGVDSQSLVLRQLRDGSRNSAGHLGARDLDPIGLLEVEHHAQWPEAIRELGIGDAKARPQPRQRGEHLTQADLRFLRTVRAGVRTCRKFRRRRLVTPAADRVAENHPDATPASTLSADRGSPAEKASRKQAMASNVDSANLPIAAACTRTSR